MGVPPLPECSFLKGDTGPWATWGAGPPRPGPPAPVPRGSLSNPWTRCPPDAEQRPEQGLAGGGHGPRTAVYPVRVSGGCRGAQGGEGQVAGLWACGGGLGSELGLSGLAHSPAAGTLVVAPSPYLPGPKANQWLSPAGLSGALATGPPVLVPPGCSMETEPLLSLLEQGRGILTFGGQIAVHGKLCLHEPPHEGRGFGGEPPAGSDHSLPRSLSPRSSSSLFLRVGPPGGAAGERAGERR